MSLHNEYLVNDPWLGNIAFEIVSLYAEYGKPSVDHTTRWTMPTAMFIGSNPADMGDWQGHEGEAAKWFNDGITALYEMLDYRYIGSGEWTCGAYYLSDECREFRDTATAMIDDWVRNKAFDTFCDDPYGIVD